MTDAGWRANYRVRVSIRYKSMVKLFSIQEVKNDS